MSELPEGIEPAPIPEPIDSALGIVLRRRGDSRCDVLLGRRARKARFMPGNLVFPGGKLDPQDEPGREGAFARCASREVREETGIDVPPNVWAPAGERTTPPIYPVRFRTQFFVALLPDGAALPDTPPAPEEIESLSFADPRAVLSDWESGSSLVPPPLLPILRRLDGEPPLPVSEIADAVAEVNRAEDKNPRIEFIPGIWVLPVKTRTLPPACCTNVWMPGGRRFVVIDPGSADPGENARLLSVINRRVAGGDVLTAIVLSHHHRDHVSGIGSIAAALGVPVLAHDETFARMRTLGKGVTTRSLNDGDTLDLDGMTLEVLHTPGHAPGHLAFFERKRRVLIACDLVSGLSTILVGSDGGDMDTYLGALRRAEALDPKVVLPSHGPPLPGKALASTISHRAAREARILAVLADHAFSELSTIAAAAYADTPQAPAFLSELQTRSHLDRLVRQGQVVQEGDRYRIPGTAMLS